MSSIHVLEGDEKDGIRAIFSELPKDRVMQELKNAVDEVAQKVLDSVQDYMLDEYVLQFEEAVVKKARRIVEAILRGESLESFGLRLQERWNKPDEQFAYDREKIRETLVRDFGDAIMTAEMHELKKENQRLAEDLKYYRNR